MGTFLAVLKIAGLVLLVLLALVLLLLAVVLFAPIRFRIDAVIPDTLIEKGFAERVKKEASGSASFHWLFHLVRGSFSYPDDKTFRVKLAWVTLIGKEEDIPKKDDISTENDILQEESLLKEDDIPKGAPVPKKEPVRKEEAIPDEAAEPKHTAASKAPEKREEKRVTRKEKPQPASSGASRESDGPGPAIPRFLAKVFELLYFILTKPYEVLWKIQYTISSVCDKITDVRIFLDSSLFERAKNVVFKQTLRLLRGLKPRKCNVRILGGTGDPALTADILAAFSALYPVFGGGIYMEPDFERGIVGLDAHLKGRITLFRILTCAGIVYFNKDVRRAYKKAKRILGR